MTTMKEEARAITKIVNILSALSAESRDRVLGYVVGLAGGARMSIGYGAPEMVFEPPPRVIGKEEQP
jgi:hypothetical protein